MEEQKRNDMSDYDFSSLNDKEFEIFCVDLLSEIYNNRFERFKPGKDSGVDGRFFADGGQEVILQCKHWSSTPLNQLIRSLGQVERPKLDKLKPSRYILAVSNALSRSDKKLMAKALAPYIKSESDIYGREDLNDLLKDHKRVEKRHYKLWINSTSVIGHIFNNAIHGRSAFSLEEIASSAARYVITSNHHKALDILERLRVVIITGDPGVGKTTLADHLCLHYAADGFEYLKIAKDIEEAESAFNPDTKQVIYFDDFLGRNYMEALKGHDGSHISQFIRRIASNKHKRFVLTSRNTILNQGKILVDDFEHINIKRNEYELLITSLSEMDKAHILYNHIWHSGLDNDYIEELYKEKRYRKIISHKNYNPRLISYVTDFTRLESCPATEYWNYVSHSLDHPSQIWENPFLAQQDDFGRAIIFLVVLNRRPIRENVLNEAYQRLISLPENQNMHGRREFQSNIRILSGSFLNRTIGQIGQPTIDVFNPSIADFVLDHYAGDIVAVQLAVACLRTEECVVTVRSLVRNELLAAKDAFAIYDNVIKRLATDDFVGSSVSFVFSLCEAFSRREVWPEIDATWEAALRYILGENTGLPIQGRFFALQWALSKNKVDADTTLEVIKENIEAIITDEEINAATSLLAEIPGDTYGHDEVAGQIYEQVLELVADNLAEYVDVTDAFSKVSYGEGDAAREELKDLVEAKLCYLGIAYNDPDINIILDRYDVSYELERYFINSGDGDWTPSESPSGPGIDEVDDLFDRG